MTLTPEDIIAAEGYTLTRTVSESDIYQFAGITGDLSRYHTDEEFMKRSPYGGRVAHGVLILGLVSTASTRFWEKLDFAGMGISLGYDRVRFVNGVLIGDTLTAHYKVTQWLPERSRFHAQAVVTNQNGGVCLSATHVTKAFNQTIDAAENGQRS
ncbi:acyl dehydratase [Georgenia soli]|uniref:Acyl dehydratase n=1 Tax=Georgenia soli TaxID=638953 RepID=A0A2A9F2W0_9MICO|nr:MaoC/PaaZ C-terminal domain-containing protein [Georgenia soli]PFG45111.1 acyl dehydratase [Georgenia soli]